MAEIRKCRAAEIFDDPSSAELFVEYTIECANPLLRSTAPQRQMYEQLEELGAAQCFAARVDGRLIGFAFVIMSPLMHYGVKFATVESLFVTKAARIGGAGVALMAAVDEYARAAECKAIFYSAPVNSQLARLLFLLADEYRHTNHIFTKRL